mmetsp:Transcript_18027/g.49082  ORF Transcript_18027/g.49082 Transcript_18027/m.49082 type:complete len:416 (+) Transcript_18027:150-1397(+)
MPCVVSPVEVKLRSVWWLACVPSMQQRTEWKYMATGVGLCRSTKNDPLLVYTRYFVQHSQFLLFWLCFIFGESFLAIKQRKSSLVGGKYHVISGPGPSSKFRGLVIHKGLSNFGLRIHDKGPILRHWLLNGFALHPQEFGIFAKGRGDFNFHLLCSVHFQRNFFFDGFSIHQNTRFAFNIEQGTIDRLFVCLGQDEFPTGLNDNVHQCNVIGRVPGPRIRWRLIVRVNSQVIGSDPNRCRGFAVIGSVLGHVIFPKHGKARLDHFRTRREIEPDLKESKRILLVRFDQRKHFTVNDTFARGHPLQIAFSVASTIPRRIGMVNDSFNRRRDGFKSTVRMLRKSGHLGSMVHAIGFLWIKVRTVARKGSFHFAVSLRVIVLVIDAKEIGISSGIRTGLGERTVGKNGTTNGFGHCID